MEESKNFRSHLGYPRAEIVVWLEKFIEVAFRFAEYVLIAGAFIYLAVATKNWAVILIAATIGGALVIYMSMQLWGFTFFYWRGATGKKKVMLLLLDAGIYLGLSQVLKTAIAAVLKAFESGVGV